MAESLRIVIVDDSEAMRGVLLRALKSFGWKVMVVEAGGAREALDKIRDSRPHLVITDWSMPEVSGLELLTFLKQRGLKTPVGMVTGNSSVDERHQALAAGAAFVIAKPFQPDELKQAIRRALDIPALPEKIQIQAPRFFTLGGRCIKAFGRMIGQTTSIEDAEVISLDGSIGFAAAFCDPAGLVRFVVALEHALALAALKVMNPQSVDTSSPKQRRFNPKQRETLREVGNIFRGALTEETGLQLRLAHTIYRGDGGFRGKPWQPLLTSMPFLSSSRYCHRVSIDQFGGGRLSLFELTHSSVSDSVESDGPS